MLDTLRGSVLGTGDDFIVIECGGVGFRVRVPRTTAAAALLGRETHLHCRLLLKDELFHLYGFSSALERDTFVLLQNVSGLGPEKALAVLNALAPAQIATAVEDKLPKLFKGIRGVGDKLAQRIVLELHGRFANHLRADVAPTTSPHGRASDLAGTLIALGYSRAAAEDTARTVVEEAAAGTTLEHLVKHALRRMSQAGNLESGR